MIDEELNAALRKALDARSLREMREAYKPGRITTHYIQPQGYWRQGQGRPTIVAESPAVAQEMGRCATARLLKGDRITKAPIGTLTGESIHPGVCPWCDYPVPVLIVACDHATWLSRCVDFETETWVFRHGHEYVRSTNRSGEYDNPEWAAYWAAHRPAVAA